MICLEANFLTWSQPRCLRPSRLVLSDASHVGNARLPFWCVLQFAPDSASFVLSFALDVPSRSLPFRSTPTYAVSSHVDAIAPSYQKIYNWLITRCVLSLLYHFRRIDGAHTNARIPRVGGLNFNPFVFPVFGVRLGVYVLLITSFFSTPFVVVNCTPDWLPRYSIASVFLFILCLILRID